MEERLVKDMSPLGWIGYSFGMGLLGVIPYIGVFAVLGLNLYFAFSDSYDDHVLKNYSRSTLILLAFALIVVLGFMGSMY